MTITLSSLKTILFFIIRLNMGLSTGRVKCKVDHYYGYGAFTTSGYGCIPCTGGRTTNGMSGMSDVSACTCDGGYGADSIYDRCEECPVGTYNPGMATSTRDYTESCTECPDDEYTERTRSYTCTACWFGAVSNKERSGCVRNSKGE